MRRKSGVWHGSGARQGSNHRDDEHGTSNGKLSYFLRTCYEVRSTTCMRPLLLLTSSSFSRAQKGPDLEHVPDRELIRGSYMLCLSSSHLSIFSSKTFSTFCRRGTCFLLYLQLFQSADLRLSNAFNGVNGCVCTIKWFNYQLKSFPKYRFLLWNRENFMIHYNS